MQLNMTSCDVITKTLQSLQLIGASMSEPLSSDLNVNFVCLSVCHGWTVNLP